MPMTLYPPADHSLAGFDVGPIPQFFQLDHEQRNENVDCNQASAQHCREHIGRTEDAHSVRHVSVQFTPAIEEYETGNAEKRPRRAVEGPYAEFSQRQAREPTWARAPGEGTGLAAVTRAVPAEKVFRRAVGHGEAAVAQLSTE